MFWKKCGNAGNYQICGISRTIAGWLTPMVTLQKYVHSFTITKKIVLPMGVGKTTLYLGQDGPPHARPSQFPTANSIILNCRQMTALLCVIETCSWLRPVLRARSHPVPGVVAGSGTMQISNIMDVISIFIHITHECMDSKKLIMWSHTESDV